MYWRFVLLMALAFWTHTIGLADGAEPVPQIVQPVPFQVVQREGFDPLHAHEHEPGGAKLGYADVALQAEFPGLNDATAEFRVLPVKDAFGSGIEWTRLDAAIQGGKLAATARIPAGGWYRLEVRAMSGDKVLATAATEPLGVGEVFVIAGQSYAAGANDELLKVDDPQGRVVAFNTIKSSWATAHDPQPNLGDGGTIWPPVGNHLLPLVRVPIGFVNVAVGGTSSRQWLPGEALYKNLAEAGKTTGSFRAVLWQQGESDVIEKTSTEKYAENLTAIREGLAKEWGFDPPWLLAKSTLHPTVYNDPAGEGRIRDAIDLLCEKPHFLQGPDTDILAGENRGALGTRRHFTGVGQRRAGLMWMVSLWEHLNHLQSTDRKRP